ncbi:MAG TPA: alpha/beta hydrolase [Ktedonobacterales bacterium]
MSAANMWDKVPPRSNYPLASGVRCRTIGTSRLRQHIYAGTHETGERLLLVHGNASSARFFEWLIASLPELECVAPDLRGYGATEARPVDATRGLRDFSDDLEALVEALGWERFHLLGWSLGGNIAMQYTIDHPERVQTLTLHAAGSPYGYGGSHGDDGAPNYPDFAGSGGGLIAPAVIERYQAKDFTADSPFSPRSALRSIIVKPGFLLPPEREDALVEQMLMMVIGDEFYPGDGVASANWPFTGPGVWGANNALSPKYCNLSGLADIQPQPPILWARGADDVMVSDAAAVDPATLGQMGAIPGWPGAEVCPPQPMVRQLRAVLDAYRANGGVYDEQVIADCGHSPLLEKPDEFRAALLALIDGRRLVERPQPEPEPSTEPPASAAPAQAKRGPLNWFRRR